MKNLEQRAEEILMAMSLTGADVRRLMRSNKIKIRDLAATMGVTLKQVRRYRSDGYVAVGHGAAELIEYLTGTRRIHWLYVARMGNMRCQKN